MPSDLNRPPSPPRPLTTTEIIRRQEAEKRRQQRPVAGSAGGQARIGGVGWDLFTAHRVVSSVGGVVTESWEYLNNCTVDPTYDTLVPNKGGTSLWEIDVGADFTGADGTLFGVALIAPSWEIGSQALGITGQSSLCSVNSTAFPIGASILARGVYLSVGAVALPGQSVSDWQLDAVVVATFKKSL